MADQYKQIGNAVPVNMAYAIGRSLIRLFNDIDALYPEETRYVEACEVACQMVPPQLFPLDYSDLKQKYPDVIVKNEIVAEDIILDKSRNVLVGLVKNDNISCYNKSWQYDHYNMKCYRFSPIRPTHYVIYPK